MSKVYAGAVDSHGRIVAAGWTTAKLFSQRIALARYKPNGHLDRSFGDGGEVRTRFSRFDASARAIVLDSKGRIVVAGSGPGDSWVLARYEPNGKLDRSFGTGAKVSTPFADFDGAQSVAIDSRGRIVAGGFTLRDIAESRKAGHSRHFGVARYSEDGSLDGSFGDRGEATTDFEGRSVAEDVSIDSRGRIVAAGRAATPGDRKFALARYLPDGRLDPAFSRNGKAITTFGNGVQGANGVAIDPSTG